MENKETCNLLTERNNLFVYLETKNIKSSRLITNNHKTKRTLTFGTESAVMKRYE